MDIPIERYALFTKFKLFFWTILRSMHRAQENNSIYLWFPVSIVRSYVSGSWKPKSQPVMVLGYNPIRKYWITSFDIYRPNVIYTLF